jgi:hypothetical protein
MESMEESAAKFEEEVGRRGRRSSSGLTNWLS